MPGWLNDPRSGERGQALPLIVGIFLIFVVSGVMFIDLFAFKTTAVSSMDVAMRSGTLAGLGTRRFTDPMSTTQNVLARLNIDSAAFRASSVGSPTAEDNIRDYVAWQIFGVKPGTWQAGTVYDGTAALSSTISDTLGVLKHGTTCSGQPCSGLDVEIISPAQHRGQTTWAAYNAINGSGLEVLTVMNPGLFPESVVSSITGQPITSTSVIVRLRLNVRTIEGGTSSTVRSLASSGGTDQ